MKVGNQEGSGFPPLTRAQWIIVILGIIAGVSADPGAPPRRGRNAKQALTEHPGRDPAVRVKAPTWLQP